MKITVFGLAVLVFTTSLCGQTRAPLDPHEVANTYQMIAQLRGDQQRSAYGSLTPEMKAAIWRYQLKSYDTVHPQLTAEQHKVIADAIYLIDTGLFQDLYPDGSSALRAELDALAAATLAVFPRRVAGAVFGNLGIPEAGAPSPSSFVYSVDCNCNIYHDFCDVPLTGIIFCSKFPRCNESSTGCGWFWSQQCNGTCS